MDQETRQPGAQEACYLVESCWVVTLRDVVMAAKSACLVGLTVGLPGPLTCHLPPVRIGLACLLHTILIRTRNVEINSQEDLNQSFTVLDGTNNSET